MYLPYLRGKQYELIALREMCEIMAKNKDKISPIIEPVKDSPTLKSCITCLADNKVNFSVVINPSVGDLKGDSKHTKKIINYLSDLLNGFDDWQIGILIDQNLEVNTILEQVLELGFHAKRLTLIHNSVRRDIEQLLTEASNGNHIEFNVINYTRVNDRRYHRNFPRNTIVSLEDFFASQDRNSDYLEVGESDFSVEHLYFADDGFKGFSDFLTVGEPYADGGYLPYAVAIHLSYTDEDNRIIVKHFVSDTNEDATDVGGKFAEALDKLIKWCNQNPQLDTLGIRGFKDLHKRSHFPGLGSIKKLSIMHHIELVLSLI